MREISSDRDTLIARAVRDARPSGDGWVRASCPFCAGRLGKADRGAAWGMQISSKYWHCFRCHARGVFRGDGFVPETDAPVERVELEMPSDFLPLGREPGASAICAEQARGYLARRGVRQDVIVAAGIGAAISGRHSGRIVVPVLDDVGEEWVGWVGRAWVPSSLPYLYPRGMARGAVIYNHEALGVETDVPLIVVEGVFDCFPFWPDGVAVLGKPSRAQEEALSAARRPVAVVLDGDAWAEGWALSERLRMRGQRAGFVRLPPRTDPDEVDPAWLREAATRCAAKI